ncbi:ArsR/SmtB family transcription factor [Pseudarthrobacter sp. Y6]|uniref:ArsR/SmtB family transcription factor n=1 Tax=Pseudarthrobacter sp. Y6 TaxID=3418422 RepID=UPI003CF9930E
MKLLQHPRVEDFDLAALMHACSDPTRLKLLLDLSHNPGKTCGTFDADVSKSTLSGHFKVLREAGLIRQEHGPGNSRLNWLRINDVETRFPGVIPTVLNALEQEISRVRVAPETNPRSGVV